MENQNLVTEEEKALNINHLSNNYLTETRKWTYFLSIIGFVFVGLMVVASVIVGIVFSVMPTFDSPMPFPMSLFALLYLVLALVYFFPVYYLYQFSVKMKSALLQKAEDSLEASFGFLKSHYKFLGIFTIVMLVLYPILIVGMVLFSLMNNI